MKNNKQLDFTPFNQIDIDALLANIPDTKGKIKNYKTMSILDGKTDKTVYALCAKDIETDKWIFMCDGNRALVFSTKTIANTVCKAFKESLNSTLA